MLEKEKSLFEQLLYSARLTMSYYLDPNRDKGEKPITSFEHRKVFESYPKSIAQFMPFIDFDMDTNVFIFDDCTTTAMVFDVKPIATEGRSESQIADYAAAIDRALSSTFEEHEEHEGEWVFQQFRWKDDDLQSLVDDALLYTNSDIRESEFTQVMLNQVMRKHLNSVSREGGLFFDDKVTKTPFEGGIERTKIIFYRKSRKSSKKNRRQDPVKEITAKAKALKSMLQSYGVELLENNDFDFFHWLVKFFNEAPEGVDPKTWYESITPSKTKRGSLPDDIPAALFTQRPKFNEQDSCYEIGSKTYKIVRVGGLNQTTVDAQLTGELRVGENVKCFTDSMPSGTMMCMTTVFCSKNYVSSILNVKEQLSKSSVGQENVDARASNQHHRECLGEKSNRPTMTSLCFYIKGNNLDEVEDKVTELNSALENTSITPIREGEYCDPLAANAFLYHLPMCFDPTVTTAKECLLPMYLFDVSNLSFFFGREIGTGNPLLIMFNRSGGALTRDILAKSDRESNAHMLIIGSTGAGKSATLSYLILILVAIKRPRLYIVEAGGSFNYIYEFLKYHGLTTNKQTMRPTKGTHTCPKLAPFSFLPLLVDDGYIKLTDDERRLAEHNKNFPDNKQLYAIGESTNQLSEVEAELGSDHIKILDSFVEEAEELIAQTEEDEADDQRDRLSEIELIAMIMITGGSDSIANKLTQGDRRYLKQALVNAGKVGYINDTAPNVQSVADELDRISDDQTIKRLTRKARDNLKEMASAIELYTEGFEGELLNTTPDGDIFPDVDVTVIDLAVLAKPGYESLLAIVYVSLLQQLNGLAEKYQFTGRPLVKITDESHLVTKIGLTALYLVKFVKLIRKLNGCGWFATQNMEDNADECEKMLSMIEWIMMLVPTPKELEELQKYKNLTGEQIDLAMSATKQDKSYTEGCLFGGNEKTNALFRIVQPSECLALAGTDGSEKEEVSFESRKYGVEHWRGAMIRAHKLDISRSITPLRWEFLEETGLYDEVS